MSRSGKAGLNFSKPSSTSISRVFSGRQTSMKPPNGLRLNGSVKAQWTSFWPSASVWSATPMNRVKQASDRHDDTKGTIMTTPNTPTQKAAPRQNQITSLDPGEVYAVKNGPWRGIIGMAFDKGDYLQRRHVLRGIFPDYPSDVCQVSFFGCLHQLREATSSERRRWRKLNRDGMLAARGDEIVYSSWKPEQHHEARPKQRQKKQRQKKQRQKKQHERHMRFRCFWHLRDPSGQIHVCRDLDKWAQDNQNLFHDDHADAERPFWRRIATGIRGLAVPNQPMTHYKGWTLDRNEAARRNLAHVHARFTRRQIEDATQRIRNPLCDWNRNERARIRKFTIYRMLKAKISGKEMAARLGVSRQAAWQAKDLFRLRARSPEYVEALKCWPSGQRKATVESRSCACGCGSIFTVRLSNGRRYLNPKHAGRARSNRSIRAALQVARINEAAY
jgi:hypothetical protein